VDLGFIRASSHDLVDIAECAVALPTLVAALESLRRIARQLASSDKPFRLLVTATASGLDVAADGAGRLDASARRAAIAAAAAEGIARLSLDGEILVELRPPMVDAGGVALFPPPGGFLQAVAEAEQAMAALMLGHLTGAKRVADLFSGAGSFALRLARKASVHAVESDAPSVAALDRAWRAANGLKQVTSEKRDLFRRPLLVRELAAYDGLVFDPPRAGAEDQARQIARTQIPRVAAVSCNPGTLARDLRILVDGGYRIASVTPLDQFLWSPHVEAVALLEGPRQRR
jgi:23S rRNA (uracil1939-C5)-methyltransferase